MPNKDFLLQLNDSKKLTEKKREELYEQLVELSRWENPKVFFWVWVVDNYVIDEINIRQANKEAMRRALVEFLRKIGHHLNPLPWRGEGIATKQCNYIKWVFIDWNDNYKFDELDKQPVYIVGGDAKVVEIWAASIIAKVFRDKLIKTYGELYPDLWLKNHKGYGTKKHRDYLTDKSKITSFHRVSYKPVKAILELKPRLLLHICCWPDAAIPIIDLKDNYNIICFWYDPNIQPKSEYDKRLENFKKVCEIEKLPYIEWPYDVDNFFKKIKWLENTPEKWEKCTECYDMRLEKTANLAKELSIKYWTTTLNISPHKDLEKLFKIGDKYSNPHTSSLSRSDWIEQKLEFLKIAFRKNGGFERSVEYTKKHNIYRQNYCGCVYSIRNEQNNSFTG